MSSSVNYCTLLTGAVLTLLSLFSCVAGDPLEEPQCASDFPTDRIHPAHQHVYSLNGSSWVLRESTEVFKDVDRLVKNDLTLCLKQTGDEMFAIPCFNRTRNVTTFDTKSVDIAFESYALHPESRDVSVWMRRSRTKKTQASICSRRRSSSREQEVSYPFRVPLIHTSDAGPDFSGPVTQAFVDEFMSQRFSTCFTINSHSLPSLVPCLRFVGNTTFNVVPNREDVVWVVRYGTSGIVVQARAAPVTSCRPKLKPTWIALDLIYTLIDAMD